MFPLFVLAAMVAVLGGSTSTSSSSSFGSTGAAGVGSCGGGCGCDRCGVGAGASSRNWTDKAPPSANVDPARAFAAHLVSRAMRGDVGAHQLVAVLEHAAASGNAHALELVTHMAREIPGQQPPLTAEYVFSHMRQLGPFGQA